uniref:Uncharacterized protein n=1 Tax=Chromera velia CCMP2878 TaxID=1169474 RepID=A0A0G4I626_9ALVE|eukprot:Cvel_11279.t1-p1 / transcript=Cvel_11279.t1 / gene=Cvel_11279 / organism=Chromera_velia_CCMP2878 / gene_product=Sodium/pyruvate cotransporter BASS2, chloroplastic, putative / transcript_product=Sodium/pyruvate cotransporter BASS2, chloroplastic, putative / location=Cvel_scaffold704:8681-9958(+) / protein_length=426 / sequence_SO=supercontig / SO=protein_coding / is_pseudo=false
MSLSKSRSVLLFLLCVLCCCCNPQLPVLVSGAEDTYLPSAFLNSLQSPLKSSPSSRKRTKSSPSTETAFVVPSPASLVSSNEVISRRRSTLLSAEAVEGTAPSPAANLFKLYEKVTSILTTLFPLWTIIFSVIALKSPQSFAWFNTTYFTTALAALMLSMGITLTPQDFIDCAKRPKAIGVGFVGCYGMMPLLALVLAKMARLPAELTAGLVLVGSINGGQASNLCAYIARGDVALSVLMTTATTIGAIFMTPLLCQNLLGAKVALDAAGIVRSTIQVVLGPLAVGMTMNKFCPQIVEAITPLTPIVGVLSTCLLVASSVAQVAEPILNAGMQLQTPIILLHLVGGIVGYSVPKLMGMTETTCRTIAIETSMKSSAFGFLLASLHFADFAVRVAPAVSVVWMAITGATLAVIWRFIPVKEETGKTD